MVSNLESSAGQILGCILTLPTAVPLMSLKIFPPLLTAGPTCGNPGLVKIGCFYTYVKCYTLAWWKLHILKMPSRNSCFVTQSLAHCLLHIFITVAEAQGHYTERKPKSLDFVGGFAAGVQDKMVHSICFKFNKLEKVRDKCKL